MSAVAELQLLADHQAGEQLREREVVPAARVAAASVMSVLQPLLRESNRKHEPREGKAR